jgi:hypothetical protein
MDISTSLHQRDLRIVARRYANNGFIGTWQLCVILVPIGSALA